MILHTPYVKFCTWAILKPDPKTVQNHAYAIIVCIMANSEGIVIMIRMLEMWFSSKPKNF